MHTYLRLPGGSPAVHISQVLQPKNLIRMYKFNFSQNECVKSDVASENLQKHSQCSVQYKI